MVLDSHYVRKIMPEPSGVCGCFCVRAVCFGSFFGVVLCVGIFRSVSATGAESDAASKEQGENFFICFIIFHGFHPSFLCIEFVAFVSIHSILQMGGMSNGVLGKWFEAAACGRLWDWMMKGILRWELG